MEFVRRRMTRAFAPAAARNQRPIADVLLEVLPSRGLVLEIASGTGQHAAFFAERIPTLTWQPSDISPTAVASIDAHVRELRRPNLLPAIQLDAAAAEWPIATANAVVCINMIHIAPWEAAVGLFEGAASLLSAGEHLVTYGPYRLHGNHTAASNARFDASLRAQDPRWGVRDVDALDALGRQHAFDRDKTVPMPANNFTLVWTKTVRS